MARRMSADSRAVLIEHGMLVADGAPADVVTLYRERVTAAESSRALPGHPGRPHKA